MSELVSPNGTPLKGAVQLSSRQLTLVVDPATHAMLGDVAQANGVTIHDAAGQLLRNVTLEAHKDLRRQKFIYLVCHWLTWTRVL